MRNNKTNEFPRFEQGQTREVEGGGARGAGGGGHAGQGKLATQSGKQGQGTSRFMLWPWVQSQSKPNRSVAASKNLPHRSRDCVVLCGSTVGDSSNVSAQLKLRAPCEIVGVGQLPSSMSCTSERYWKLRPSRRVGE